MLMSETLLVDENKPANKNNLLSENKLGNLSEYEVLYRVGKFVVAIGTWRWKGEVTYNQIAMRWSNKEGEDTGMGFPHGFCNHRKKNYPTWFHIHEDLAEVFLNSLKEKVAANENQKKATEDIEKIEDALKRFLEKG